MSKTDNYGWTDEAPDSSSYLNPVIARLVGPSRLEILDAGCGNGALADHLAQFGHAVTGVDGDRGAIEIARAKFPGIRFENILFDQDPAALGATSDGHFDVVVSTEVVEHLYDPRELARFAFAALRPGGRLLISTPYHGYLKNLMLSVFDRWDRHIDPHWHGGHIKFWSRPTLEKLLRDAGFVVDGFVGVGRVAYLWKSMILTARRPG